VLCGVGIQFPSTSMNQTYRTALVGQMTSCHIFYFNVLFTSLSTVIFTRTVLCGVGIHFPLTRMNQTHRTALMGQITSCHVFYFNVLFTYSLL
jgi:hypothetical protein